MRRFGSREIVLEIHPSVEDALRDETFGVLAELERRIGRRIGVRANDSFDREQFEILAV